MIPSKRKLAVFLAIAITSCTVSRSKADTNYDLIDDWPRFLESSYSSLKKPPWRESLQALLPYVSAPEIIGVYDIETIGLLWISTLHQNRISEHLNAVEVPYHLNIYRVLLRTKANSASDSKEETTRNSSEEQKLKEKAVALVRYYSRYYTPIKQKGAFTARDNLARKELTTLAGEEAIQAMDDDYINGTRKLVKLSINQLLEFRIQELKDMAFDAGDEQIQKELGSTLKTASKSDVIAIKTLWKELLSKDAKLPDALKKYKTKFPNCESVDSFNIAINLKKEAVAWIDNAPPIRSPGFGPLLGDGPAWLRYPSSFQKSMEETQIKSEEFGFYDIVEKITELTNAYITMKLTYEAITVPSKVAHQSTRSVLKDFRFEFFQRAKREMSHLVGEEAASNLETFWESNQNHHD